MSATKDLPFLGVLEKDTVRLFAPRSDLDELCTGALGEFLAPFNGPAGTAIFEDTYGLPAATSPRGRACCSGRATACSSTRPTTSTVGHSAEYRRRATPGGWTSATTTTFSSTGCS